MFHQNMQVKNFMVKMLLTMQDEHGYQIIMEMMVMICGDLKRVHQKQGNDRVRMVIIYRQVMIIILCILNGKIYVDIVN
jgi:hypothetical protein